MILYLQIHDQDLSRCIASTKDLKSSFGASTVFGPSLEDEKASSEDFKKMKTCV